MKLPSVVDFAVKGKRVLLRTNYDVVLKKSEQLTANSEGSKKCHDDGGHCCGKCEHEHYEIEDTSRIDESLPTLKYLLGEGAQVTILSHLGRPEGKVVAQMSLKPVAEYLSKLLPGEKNCQMRENLRFEEGEEKNYPGFAKELADGYDFFVNDAFACAHRAHASIVGLPKLLPSAFGFDFLEEMDNLGKVMERKEGTVVILGGAKLDKLDVMEKLTKKVEWVLVGGLLPLKAKNMESGIRNLEIATLDESGKDITQGSIDKFKKIIAKAKTIVWAGPMGLYEEKEHEKGTKEIAEAVVNSGAFTIVGGGDTEAALRQYGLVHKINYISSGGGAMLEYLAKGTLPGIEAILKQKFSI